jgi:N-acetylmuramoyl-L-alanine amidase
MISPGEDVLRSIQSLCRGLGFSFVMLLSLSSFATEEDRDRPWRENLSSLFEQRFSGRDKILASPKEFSEIQRLDGAFSVSSEVYPQELAGPVRWDLPDQEWNQRLRIFDPDASFRRFLTRSSTGILVYQDRDYRVVPDFQINKLILPPLQHLTAMAAAALHNTSLAPKRGPLAGIRIALDPGHIGSALWDLRDGKYIKDRQGRLLSEGVMALQTALLLESELIALGADVFLTRRSFVPVFQSETYEKFDLRPFANEEFQSSRLEDWFLKLLMTVSPANLIGASRNDPNVRRIFKDGTWARYRYFFQRAELQERAAAINAFHPDLTVIIHFDVDVPSNGSHGLNPQNYNSTKAFVPGHFLFSEVSSRAERAQLARGLVQSTIWENSVRLSRNITHSISQRLAIPLDKGQPSFVTAIEPGVFARNLGLLRRLSGPGAAAYLECLFYNGPAEFEKLVHKDFALDIDGTRTFYSQRLKSLVEAIRDGLLAYRP